MIKQVYSDEALDHSAVFKLRIIENITLCFVSCYESVGKHPIAVSSTYHFASNGHAVVTLVLLQDAWNIVLFNTRHF